MEPLLVFWKAYATYKEGAVTEAIHELSSIVSKREIQFATLLALAFYHRRCNIPDQEAIATLDKQLAATERSASEKAAVVAAQFMWYVGETTKAKQLLKAVALV